MKFGKSGRFLTSTNVGLQVILLLSLVFLWLSSLSLSSSVARVRNVFLCMLLTSSLCSPDRGSGLAFCSLALAIIFWKWRCESGWRMLNFLAALLFIIALLLVFSNAVMFQCWLVGVVALNERYRVARPVSWCGLARARAKLPSVTSRVNSSGCILQAAQWLITQYCRNYSLIIEIMYYFWQVCVFYKLWCKICALFCVFSVCNVNICIRYSNSTSYVTLSPDHLQPEDSSKIGTIGPQQLGRCTAACSCSTGAECTRNRTFCMCGRMLMQEMSRIKILKTDLFSENGMVGMCSGVDWNSGYF